MCVDTGDDTPTGERIARVREHVGEATFCATYADGVADIDLAAQAEFHDAPRRAGHADGGAAGAAVRLRAPGR